MKLGFLGYGNMGSAIAKGAINSSIISKSDIYIYDLDKDKIKDLKNDDYNATDDLNYIIDKADYIILAVKPNVLDNLLSRIKESCNFENKVFISIAAGYEIKKIEANLTSSAKIIRIMPNTPALVLQAMSALSYNKNVSADEIKYVLDIFNSFGKCEVVDEKLMDAVTAVSGSSPAYVFMMIEAMADAAVSQGMPRDKAYVFAAQAIKGSAQMVLETKEHPAKLKDNVCSPGGTTIEAVRVLEEKGFRSALVDAMNACYEKSKSMK